MSDTPQEPPRVGNWVHVEGTAAKVHFTDPETGEETWTIFIPYDPDNPPTEAEALEQADTFYSRLEAARGSLTEEGIEAVAEELRTSGYGKWMARELRAIFRSGVKITPKSGDDATPEEIAERKATAAEMDALLRDEGDTLANALLEASPRWREFAIHALSQSWAQALSDLLEKHPDASDWADDRFDLAIKARYEEGDYFTGAVLNTVNTWLEIIARDIAGELESRDGQLGPLAEIIEQKARERIRARIPRPQLPAMAPAHINGWGRASSVPLVQGIIDSFWKPGIWTTDRTAWPEARFSGGGKHRARFRITFHEPHTLATEAELRAAWEWADGIDDWTEEVIVQLLKIYHYNKSHNGTIVTDTNTLLRAMGHERPKGIYQDRVNRALYLGSRLVVQDLYYKLRETKRHERPAERDFSGFAQHLYTYDYTPPRKGKGKNLQFMIRLGDPLLRMVDDPHSQLAEIPAGITAPDARSPYRNALNRRLPIKAKERRAQFTEHGITVRELLSMAGLDVARVDPRKRTEWRKEAFPEL